jgi:AcrR family transcriptional regulator
MPPDKKKEILDAAASCFARFGYEKTTLDDIGELVGMNKVSLYYYFKNKEALFKEMLQRESEDYINRMKLKIKEFDDPRHRIIAWIEASFRYGQESSILRQLSFESLKRLSPLLDEFKASSMSAGIEFVGYFLKTGIERGELKECDTARVAESIVRIVFAMKDAAYKKLGIDPQAGLDVEGLIGDVCFSVGLMLDGLIRR